MSGFSLKDALKPEVSRKEETAEGPAAPADEPDEAVEQKLTEACRELKEQMEEERRSRLVIAFARAAVEGNCIRLAVPNENLKEEVERHMLDLKKRLADLSGVRGPIEFEIRVEADTSVDRPVSSEDKLKFLAGQNEHLAAFKKALDLDIE